MEENKESAQDAIRKMNKKDILSYGENKTGLTAVFILSQEIPRKSVDLNSFNIILMFFLMFDIKE